MTTLATTSNSPSSNTPTVPVRVSFDQLGAGFVSALTQLGKAATKELDRVAFDARLRELVRIRVSQINGCAFCIDMHTTDARAVGESEQRLYALTAWRDTPFFSERERAALAFAESVASMSVDHVPDEAYDGVASEFDPQEVTALLSLIVSINAWNAVGVSTHAWLPGSYQP